MIDMPSVEDLERRGLIRKTLTGLLVVIVLVVGALNAATSLVRADSDATEAVVDVVTSPGRPLDAVRYKAPTMSGDRWCWYMVDRTHGMSWWIVRLPDGDGHMRQHVLPVYVGEPPASDDLG